MRLHGGGGMIPTSPSLATLLIWSVTEKDLKKVALTWLRFRRSRDLSMRAKNKPQHKQLAEKAPLRSGRLISRRSHGDRAERERRGVSPAAIGLLNLPIGTPKVTRGRSLRLRHRLPQRRPANGVAWEKLQVAERWMLGCCFELYFFRFFPFFLFLFAFRLLAWHFERVRRSEKGKGKKTRNGTGFYLFILFGRIFWKREAWSGERENKAIR